MVGLAFLGLYAPYIFSLCPAWAFASWLTSAGNQVAAHQGTQQELGGLWELHRLLILRLWIQLSFPRQNQLLLVKSPPLPPTHRGLWPRNQALGGTESVPLTKSCSRAGKSGEGGQSGQMVAEGIGRPGTAAAPDRCTPRERLRPTKGSPASLLGAGRPIPRDLSQRG